MAILNGTPGDDDIDGTADDDTITDGGGGSDGIFGLDGNDVITTTGGLDFIDGGNGTDRLIIDLGLFSQLTLGLTSATIDAAGLQFFNIENFTVRSGNGNDRVTLGAGNHDIAVRNGDDLVSLLAGSITADGGAGSDTISFQRATGAVTLDLATGAITSTVLTGSVINFELAIGSAFADRFTAASTTSSLDGGGGDDVLDTASRAGAISLAGQDGNDVFIVRSAATATISGGNGTDRVETDLASFTLPGDVENLEYFGSAAFNGTGNALANSIVGGASGDTLSGLDGDDTLGGEAGSDTLNGGDGNDRLIGGTGSDTLNGGAGNDILVIDQTGDVANGGDGNDTLQIMAGNNSIGLFGLIPYVIAADIETVQVLSASDVGIRLNALDNLFGGQNGQDFVYAGAGNDTVYCRGGPDNALGEDGNDRLFGEAGSDRLEGGNGADLLYGGADNDGVLGDAGNDTLYGEAGIDTLIGGTGADQLFGGLGADTFLFQTGDTGTTIATADRIRDFAQAQGDRIDLAAIDAVTGGTDNAFNFIGTAAFGNVAGQLRYEVVSGETRITGDINGDGVADFLIRIDGVHALGAGDFVL